MKRLHAFAFIIFLCQATFLAEKIIAQGFPVIVSTTVTPPVSPAFNNAFFSGGRGVRSTMVFQFDDPSLANNPSSNEPYTFFIQGRLERLPPSPFSIELNPSFLTDLSSYTSTKPPSSHQLTASEFQGAFGSFIPARLIFDGIAPTEIVQANNQFRLPDGMYRVCFAVFGLLRQGGLKRVSAPGSGCATFTICSRAQAAPQFVQPVNNQNFTSSINTIRPISPVVFTWTPPQSFCGSPRGGYQYDFEIREMLSNQTVIDAMNNPYVFQKRALPSTTFLLDTNLYRGVLQQGKRYAIRVKANNASLLDTFSIDNNGYSRVEAFQYGTSSDVVISPVSGFPVQPPQFYYIPFGERKTLGWDDAYTAYRNGTGKDTAVPIKEYIALNLIQEGIAYNLDAIELFMALNPHLAGLKEVRLSNKAKLPEFPVVSEQDRSSFEAQHAINLTPDAQESERFRQLTDSLTIGNFIQRLEPATGLLFSGMTTELQTFRRTVQRVNRVTVKLLNELMAELLYNLRQPGQPNGGASAHISNVVANIRELMTNTPNTTSFLFPKNSRHSSLSGLSISSPFSWPAAAEGELLPVDVIVWKGSDEPPARPISSAPELRRVYRVLYTTTALYNNKNPEVKVNVLPALASTSQGSLPKLGRFKFWTVNLKSKHQTQAQDVETSDIFILNTRKKWPGSKRLYVVLKVE